MKGTSAVFLGALLSQLAFGADWESEIELGAVMTTGNTEQENVKLVAHTNAETEHLKHEARFDALRSSDEDAVTAQKYYGFYQIDYKLNEKESIFGRVSYLDDRFSGFEYQTDATAGYSRVLFENDTMTWSGDVGIGARRSELSMNGAETEFITRLATEYQWQLSESAKFRQYLSTEIGDESTITRSETSLQSSIVGALAMKLSLTVRNQTEVPPDIEKTDTETSVTMVYTF